MENITIPMEEYKELLIIKGKYEELKAQKMIMDWDKLLQRPSLSDYPYKVFCKGD